METSRWARRRLVSQALAALLAFTVIAAASAPASADSKQRIRVSAKVAPVALSGDRTAVKGRVRGSKRSIGVALQQRRRGRWTVLARGRTRGKQQRFKLGWRATRGRSVAVLRVVAGPPRRPRAVSPKRRVAVTPSKVLRPAKVTSAPPAGQAGKLRYDGNVDTRAGEFVALDVGPETPSGLLAKVVSVKHKRGNTILTVQPAELPDVVPVGEIAIGAAADAAKKRSAHAAATPRGFGSALQCSGGVQGELKGSLSVDLNPHFELGWSWGRVKRAEASATVTGRADLSAKIGGQASCSLSETAVANWTAPTIRFSIGPVPVVIVPKTTLYVSASGNASAAAETSIGGFVRATAGIRYDDGIHPIGSFDHGFTSTPPTANADVSLSGRVIPSVTLLMYGVGGPRFDLATGLKLDAGTTREPRWEINAPVELRAGLEVPGFRQFSVSPRTVLSRTFLVAKAPPTPVAPPPPPPASVERMRMQWDTDATDINLHVWDIDGNHAYFGDQLAIPEAELSIDEVEGFGPEWFTAPANRTYTYGLCYFDDNEIGPSVVSYRITHPDGSFVDDSVVLFGTADWIVLGSSPPGAEYTPFDPWCHGEGGG